MRNGTATWTRTILSAGLTQSFIQKPDRIRGKCGRTRDGRHYVFKCWIASDSESPQYPLPQQRGPWQSAHVIYQEIHINRIDSSYPPGTYNKSPSPVAVPWGELWWALPTSASVTPLPTLPWLTMPCSDEYTVALDLCYLEKKCQSFSSRKWSWT